MTSSSKVPEHLLNLAQRFFAAGWSDADVLHALDNPPDGAERVLGDPQRWEVARARLALWLDGSMRPVLSRSQLIARDNSFRRRMQWLWREAHAESGRGAADAAAAAESARQLLAQASPAAARALARRGEKSPSRMDPERWRRADEAAEAAVEAGVVVESWVPEELEPEEDPVEVARRVSRAAALRRARWERAARGGENAAG